MLKDQQVQEEIPGCFGQHFSQSAKECMGGYDDKWVDPNGIKGSIRERCNYVTSCSARTQASKAQPLIPVSSLSRNSPHTQFSGPASYARQTPAPPAGVRPWPPPGTYAPTQPYGHPQPMMQQMMPVNFAIPQYLSVREPTGNIFHRVLWEIFRSMGKAVGHTIANAFDSEAFGHRNGGQPPPPSRPEGQ